MKLLNFILILYMLSLTGCAPFYFVRHDKSENIEYNISSDELTFYTDFFTAISIEKISKTGFNYKNNEKLVSNIDFHYCINIVKHESDPDYLYHDDDIIILADNNAIKLSSSHSRKTSSISNIWDSFRSVVDEDELSLIINSKNVKIENDAISVNLNKNSIELIRQFYKEYN